MNIYNQLPKAGHLNIFQRGQILPGHFSNYSIEGFLGEGSFGKVVKCRKLDTAEAVAIKVVRKEYTQGRVKEARELEKIRKLCPDRNNLLTFTEHFMHLNHFCLVFEMLDMSLFDFMVKRNGKPLEICEIRPIAQQLLVALKALKSIDLVHADIKPDNIMLVHHESQPFKVKLIDFGLATEAPNLWKNGIVQNLSYRAPEVLLGLPSLDQAVDMWTLGCVLAFLYLGEHLYPMDDEYDTLKTIIHLNGRPDNEFLDAASKTRRFFYLAQEGGERLWWLKNESEYAYDAGVTAQYKVNTVPDFINMDGLILKQKQRRTTHIYEDTMEFISLLKQMLAVNPKKRITPQEGLHHKFITMKHLPMTTNHNYVRTVREKMRVCSFDEEDSVSPGYIAERTKRCGVSNSTDKKEETEIRLQMELEQMKLLYKNLRLKYEADVHTSRQEAKNLRQELEKERQIHAEREAQHEELVKNLRVELNAQHHQMEQERALLKQTKMRFQVELEQMKLLYKNLRLKYEADVHTSRQEAKNLRQELEKERQIHAEREAQHEELVKNLRVELNAQHHQMEQERALLKQTKMRFQVELEQMKLLYKNLRLKYEADVHTSRQEAKNLRRELEKERQIHAEREAQHEELVKNLRVELNAQHHQMEQERALLKQTKMRFQVELEEIDASYKDLRLKYEADVHTLRQEAETLGQELEKENKTHAEREAQHEELVKNMRVEFDTVHPKMEHLCEYISLEVF